MKFEEFKAKWEMINSLHPEFAVELFRDVSNTISEAIAEHEAKQCHKYPDEIPEDKQEYLIQLRWGIIELTTYSAQSGWCGRFDEDVIAFRKPPVLYQETPPATGRR